MSLAPFRGRCIHCGYDHGNGVFDLGGYKPIPLTETQMAELTRLRAEVAALRENPKIMRAPRLLRMWVNQPSTLQPLHYMHGENVYAHHEYGDTWTVHPLSVDTVSMQCPRSSLSYGWRVGGDASVAQRVAEACAKLAYIGIGTGTNNGCCPNSDWEDGQDAIGTAIRSGKWREFL